MHTAPEQDAAGPRKLTREELQALPIQALLVRTGHLTIEQLAEALRENVSNGRAVEDVVVERGWVAGGVVDKLRELKGMPPTEAGAAAPAVPAPTPAPATAPAAAAAPTPVAPVAQPVVAANGRAHTYVVSLSLAGGALVRVGRFQSEAEGEQRAQEVIESLLRPEPGTWPQFGNRLVRPEAVVAVEVARAQLD